MKPAVSAAITPTVSMLPVSAPTEAAAVIATGKHSEVPSHGESRFTRCRMERLSSCAKSAGERNRAAAPIADASLWQAHRPRPLHRNHTQWVRRCRRRGNRLFLRRVSIERGVDSRCGQPRGKFRRDPSLLRSARLTSAVASFPRQIPASFHLHVASPVQSGECTPRFRFVVLRIIFLNRTFQRYVPRTGFDDPARRSR